MPQFVSFQDINLHFSQLVGIPVFYSDERKLGKITDLFVDYEEIYPQVLALQFSKNNIPFYVKWNDIISFGPQKIVIDDNAHIGRSRTFPKLVKQRILAGPLADQFHDLAVEYPPIGKIILDRQIVDTSGKKVVRVNDIELIKTGQILRVTHAAIGLRSMLRRLGFEKSIDKIVRLSKPDAKYLHRSHLINWKYVHAIPDRSVHKSVKLTLTNKDIKELHPADLADILEDLDANARSLLFRELDPELAAETLSEVDADLQNQLVKNESPESLARIIENMPSDEAVDLLGELEEEQASAVIQEINDDEIQEDIQELLEFDEDTAGGIMSSDFFQMHEHHTRKDVLDYINKNHDELTSINDIYITDQEHRLIGICQLKDILIHKEETFLGECMNRDDLISVVTQSPWRQVALLMNKYNLINIPVIDDEQKLVGVISVDDVLPWLLDER